MLLQLVIGTRCPGHELFRPAVRVGLPRVARTGCSLGGRSPARRCSTPSSLGLRLAVLIACFGAANALAHPARLVRILPAALYEVGVAIVVAHDLRAAPGRVDRPGPRGATAAGPSRSPVSAGCAALPCPCSEEALEGAIQPWPRRWIPAATDGGPSSPPAVRRLSAAALLLGFGGADRRHLPGDRRPADQRRLGIVLLARRAGRWHWPAGCSPGAGARRTRYRPDPWRGPEWLVVGVRRRRSSLTYVSRCPTTPPRPVSRFAWPTLQLVPFLVTLVAARRPRSLTPDGALPDSPRRRRHRCASGSPRDRLRARHRHLRRRRRRRCCATSRCTSPRASCAWSSASTGSGKSTLLGAVNGLVPHFTGGTPGGR